MEYFFMQTSNPAYRYFTIKYFTDAGIEYVDEYMGPERAQAVCREIKLKKQMTEAENRFCTYVGQANADPQRRLASMMMLEMIYGAIDADMMRKLEARLPEGNRTKLVLTKREAALKIFDYYNGALRMALEDDLKNPDPRNIYNHIQTYDEDKLPDYSVGRDKFEAAARAFVEKLLLWTNEITPQGVMDDIDSILKEHDGAPNRWQRVSLRSKKQHITCHHDSKYVQITGHPQNIPEVPLQLWPSRTPAYDERHEGPEVEVPVFKVEANWLRRGELTK